MYIWKYSLALIMEKYGCSLKDKVWLIEKGDTQTIAQIKVCFHENVAFW